MAQFNTRSNQQPETPLLQQNKTSPSRTSVFTSPDREAIAPHVCGKCNARFTRLDHLKRHIASLYETPKSHACQYCGKKFSRRDVLVRHYQSCRVAREGDLNQDQITTETCETCAELKIKCTGGRQCEKCASLGQDCLYKHSPPSDQLNNMALLAQYSPKANRRESLASDGMRPMSSRSNAPVAERTRQRSDAHTIDLDGANFENTNRRVEDWPQRDESLFFDPRRAIVRRPSNEDRQPRDFRDGHDLSSKHGKSGNKRGRYTTMACMNCQRRKVKCSGEETCVPCRSASLVCVYNCSRKRKRHNTSTSNGNLGSNQERRMIDPATEFPPMPPPEEPTLNPTEASALSSIITRIASLERDRNMFKTHIAMIRDIHNLSVGPSTSSPQDYSTSPSNDSDASLPNSDITFHAATAIVPTIEALNRTVVPGQTPIEQETEEDSANAPAPTHWQDCSRGKNRDLKILEAETRAINPDTVNYSIDIFFARLNPHYPGLNENRFRVLYERWLVNDNQMGNGDWYQFIALLNLIHAEVKILGDDRTNSEHAPGWEEFCRAESITDQLIWLGNGNLWTVQILLVKSRYLLYIEKAECAYETLGQATRLCFQLGLHNQNSWVNCPPFEIAMRQRIFWSVVYFDRHLALNNGTPVFIRDFEFNVDLPKAYDDKEMFPDRPLPEERPERSCGMYLTCTARWGKLFLEIWDMMFGIQAKKPGGQDPELLASIDARILYTVTQFPKHLQWQQNLHRLEGGSGDPSFVLRQTFILHLRMNQLRQLLRHANMLSLTYDATTAADCVSISTSSIDAIRAQLSSKIYMPTDRWSSVLYLVGALLPLVCIIVRTENDQQTRALAISTFKVGVSIMSDLAPSFPLARHTIRRLNKIIGSAMQAIKLFHEAEMSALHPKEFELEILAPQINDLFMNDHRMDPARDLLDQQLGEGINYDMFPMADADYGDGNGIGIDESWLDGLLNEQMLFLSG